MSFGMARAAREAERASTRAGEASPGLSRQPVLARSWAAIARIVSATASGRSLGI